MSSTLLEQAAPLLKKLKVHGHRAFVVGGAVRDMILERPISDVDIVTSATPDEIRHIFKQSFTMSNQHQTLIVRHQNELYEITTERGLGIEEDLMCRDFTINSLALDEDGRLLDPASGVHDIEHGIIRSTKAFDRMTEDPLRMLRALRFVGELGFEMDGELRMVLKNQHQLLQHVAIERVVKEFEKLIKSNYRNKALDLVLETQLYQSIPVLKLSEGPIKQLKSLPSLAESSTVFCWTAICYCLGLTVDSSLKPVTLSNQLTNQVRNRLYFMNIEPEWDKWLVYQAGLETALDVERLRAYFGNTKTNEDKIIQLWSELPIKGLNELAVTGTDLLQQVNQPPGPWIKEELAWAELAVVKGETINDRIVLLEKLAERREKK